MAAGGPVPRQLIRTDCVWKVILAQQSLEERPCGVCVSVALEQHIEHGPVLVNRAPTPVGHPTHAHVHFIQMPPGTPVAYVLGKRTAEMDASGADRLAGDVNPALEQQLLDIPVPQGGAVGESDGMTDDRKGNRYLGSYGIGQHGFT